MKKQNIAGVLREYGLISASALLTAIAVNWFYKAFSLAPGGITGMAIILSAATKIPIQYITLLISGPLLILAALLLGKSFGLKTLYITLLTPLCMKLLPALPVTSHILPAALAGGICVGAAVGFAVTNGCATGGTDTIALLLKLIFKKTGLSTIIFILDGTVVVLSGIITKNPMVSLFSLISLGVIIATIRLITKRAEAKKDLKTAGRI